MRQKYLLYVLFATVVIGVVSNFTFGNFGWVLTPACFDAFGIGGILAYDFVYGKNFFLKRSGLLLILSGVLVILTALFYKEGYFPLRTVVAISTATIISILIFNKNSLLKKILAVPPLVFVGKISYGVYLYHNLVPWLWENLLNKLYSREIINVQFNKGALVFQEFIILILVSWLSWRIIEKPLNNLKKYFEYQSAGAVMNKPVPTAEVIYKEKATT